MQPEGANDALHMVDARLTPLVSFHESNDPWTRPPGCHPRAIADPGDAVAAVRRAMQRPVAVRVTDKLAPASREHRNAANCLQLAALSNSRGGTRTPYAGAFRSRGTRDCCSPSLDTHTQGTSCTHRLAIHVGDAWARERREAVADALREEWPERARALCECGLAPSNCDARAGTRCRA